MKFPFQAKLLSPPDETSADVMTVGQVYTVIRWAGSSFVVSCDLPGETRMVHHGRFDQVKLPVDRSSLWLHNAHIAGNNSSARSL